VHEVAQQANPAARVPYVDIDPVATAHSTAILAGNDNAAVIEADLRQPASQPASILASDTIRTMIDFSRR